MGAVHDSAEISGWGARLQLAGHGTAAVARILGRLTDAELDGDSLLPGWSRRHVVAHLASNARAMTRLLLCAETGVETVMYASADVRNDEIEKDSKLRPDELCVSFSESAGLLERAWRDLPKDRQMYPVRNGQGAMILVSDTVWMRTRELWVHAVDLNEGGSFRDVPAAVLNRLLGDIQRTWAGRGEDANRRLVVTDAPDSSVGPADMLPTGMGPTDAAAPEIVSGTLVDLTAWASGRGSAGVTSSTGETPIAARWLDPPALIRQL
ncbi:maleylpyruvate isomerase family mycothiol-dependent enzyme [Cryobacterium sp. TMT1-21]|uniref:maleylpyruvate isomerase family mycothiol-dependent enzyme n=1 Tax=Cryobacterium sp. TMT1-21 TaxID=1259234 RepID=UPI00106B0362|nr:maleylpyruvate isomerase family mycothiol-dependent enzyme [Cryobacterium sp. TMT1-21]TFD18122.1 maleylpyruvate isomerase family mycothiol-dependent enzyme [Cryobacterium sp. TMT1-21]